MELNEAREQLQFAREHLEHIRHIKNHPEFRKWWQAFRTCISTACNSVENKIIEMGYHNGSHILKPIIEARNKKETQYIIMARSAAFHKVDPISEVKPGWIKMSPGDQPNGIKQPDGSVIYQSHTLLEFKINHPQIMLLPVINRGEEYPAPSSINQGEEETLSATSLGQCAIEQIQEAINRIELLI
ncbi:hypothetical protein FEI13_05785 [Halomonas urmiana]|uniref:Uncharacterized protein n=1 Tax=Halomonas urmiana TaxID=490901 RepID=A0A5R8MJ86_9GAMM|nr:hypothetical protein [Halomonas urmiana]TLF52041.1 hypothetical protein FEI13_05785 [Halomonas urmiana]